MFDKILQKYSHLKTQQKENMLTMKVIVPSIKDDVIKLCCHFAEHFRLTIFSSNFGVQIKNVFMC